jgi:hypothetical protein
VAFHLFVTLLDLAGVAWHPLLLWGFLGAGAAVLWKGRARRDRRLPTDLGWGDGLAFVGFALFSLFAFTLWVTTPDFVFHWGLKGHRFFLVRAVDYAFLAQPESWPLHPDYPNLLPELYAAASLLLGRFDAGLLQLWSVLFFGLIVLASRVSLKAAGVDRFALQAGVALTGLVPATFGLAHRMAGAADWMIALALVAAAPALLRPADRSGDLLVGLAAAFAAASKIEGVPLAFFLCLVQLVRRLAAERRLDWRGVLWLGAPPLAVIFPWLWRCLRHGLFQEFTSGAFELERGAAIFPALLEAARSPSWYGFSALALATPLLFAVRRLRPLAAVLSLQLLFDLYAYFAAPVDTHFYVITSFPRLLLQVVPALLVAGVAALGVRALAHPMHRTVT